MRTFRFGGLEIWELGISISDRLFDIADDLEQRKLFRFSDQLRGASMSITNNIAEGSGSDLNTEFKQFLRYARRSVFECANIIIILLRRKIITIEHKEQLYIDLDILSRKIIRFMKKL